MPLLPNGKLPVRLLRKLLSCLAVDDVNDKVGPAVGDDAAAIDRGDPYPYLAADPITFPPEAHPRGLG
jgi:hydrogenase maturation factor